jgi:RNA polymerase sigma-70 factor, ECF subfamily
MSPLTEPPDARLTEGMDVGDAEAVARARAGDREGFRLLVNRHSRPLFRLAFRMTGNEQDAEDVVQEAFLRAYRGLDRFEDRSQVGSWLYRIAANCAYDVLRARQRQEDRIEDEPEDGVLVALPSAEPGPDRLALSGEVRKRLDVALARMTARERSAFVLRHFEGMSIEEIGGALGMDPSATKQSILRAVRKVRQVLAVLAGVRGDEEPVRYGPAVPPARTGETKGRGRA